MDRIVPRLRNWQRKRLQKWMGRIRDARLRQRCQIILALNAGESPTAIARVLRCSRSTVYRVAARFREEGLEGLRDRRQEPLPRKVTPEVIEAAWGILEDRPRDRGWFRSTWTCELIQKELEAEMGVSLSRSHIHRLLGRMGYRYKRPRPVVRSPEPTKWAKLRAIERMIRNLPANEVALYEDEVDIDLNPKIGAMWMRKGEQTEIVTPGQNQKRYIAGAWSTRSGRLIYVEGKQKNSDLFVALLRELCHRLRCYRRIHLILDNYKIHDSRKTRAVLKELQGRIVLHFLPTYSPNHNPIERLWEDLHANVTRNHQFETIEELLGAVRHFLSFVNPSAEAYPLLAEAA